MKKISNNRTLLDGMKGHNYGLPDCIKFILECVGWSDERLDFWDIAAITGDSVTQVYNHNLSTGCEYCVSGYLAGSEHIKYIFDTLGYNHEYITAKKLNANNDKYIKKIADMIDRNIPVLVKTNINDMPDWHSDVGTYCLIVGYDHGGQIAKLLIGGAETIDCILTGENKMDLIFIGEKQRKVSLEELYLKAICKMMHWLTLPEQDGLFFGAAAFRAWADDIEAGRYAADYIPMWENYGVYVANLATSGGIPEYILLKLAEMNSSYSYLAPIGEMIQQLLPNRSLTDGRSLLWIQLEELNGGMGFDDDFNMDKVKITMCDGKKRSKVANTLRNYAEQLDQVVELLEKGLCQY